MLWPELRCFRTFSIDVILDPGMWSVPVTHLKSGGVYGVCPEPIAVQVKKVFTYAADYSTLSDQSRMPATAYVPAPPSKPTYSVPRATGYRQ